MLQSTYLPATQWPVQSPDRPRKGALTRKQLHFMEGVSLWLAMLMLLFVQPLFAEAGERDYASREGAGEFHYLTESGRIPAPLLATDYEVTVSGLIAETRLRQSFENTSDEWQEGVYVFPLAENASVHAMTMTTGERVVVGEIREKEQARQEYEKARQEGRQTARVDQQRPNLFTTRLANIPPGETVTVELSYQQMVNYDNGTFELRLPTTITPRYMPGRPELPVSTEWTGGWALPTDQVADAHQISPPQVLPQDLPEQSHTASVTVDLRAGLPVATVTSPSHAIHDRHEGDSIHVSAADGRVAMDRDFLLRWQPVRGQEPAAAVFHEHWQGEDYLLAMLVPGEQGRIALTRELILVIDTSGSMAGASIRQAREALLQGIATLSPGDRFNIIEFNSHTRKLFPDSVEASADNLARARRYVRNLVADGGTEMAAALNAALASGDNPGVTDVRQVVFVTDGSVGNEQALFGQIRQQLGRSRLFTVGIGSAPNQHFMRQAARYGRGTATTIGDLSEVSGQMDKLFTKMQSPILTDINVTWPSGVNAAEHFPTRTGDLFHGEPMMLAARGTATQGHLEVTGDLPGGGQWRKTLSLEKAASAPGVRRYWARQQIDQLLDETLGREVDEATRERIVGLGIDHQLVTPHTSFVAVDKTPARPQEAELDQQAVPSLLPHGSSAARMSYPATATPALLMMLAGLAGLLSSGLAGWLYRRREVRSWAA